MSRAKDGRLNKGKENEDSKLEKSHDSGSNEATLLNLGRLKEQLLVTDNGDKQANAEKSLRKSSSASSLSNFQLKLLLGETASLVIDRGPQENIIRDIDKGKAGDVEQCCDNEKKTVRFRIGSGDGWDGEGSDSEDSTETYNAQGSFALNQGIVMGSFGSVGPMLKSGSFGQVALQKK